MNDLTRAVHVSKALQSGGVSVNFPHLSNINTPFRGIKQSVYGKELGRYGLLSYMEPKVVHIKY